MSTRSTIGIQNDDGSVTAIYCHWDGYPSNNGRILFNAYKDESKVRELMTIGDLSILGENIHPDPSKPHSFDFADGARQENVCLAYGRDRGEKGCEARTLFGAEKAQFAQEYDYLYKNGKWYCGHYENGKDNFKELTAQMFEEG